jgi:hypothetical protein
MARQLLAQGRLVAISELIDEVEAVDRDAIKAFANSLRREVASVAVIGSGKKSAAQASRVAGLFNPVRADAMVSQGSR